MIDSIAKLFRKKIKFKQLKILDLNFSDLSNDTHLINQIFDEQIDGVIIRNFLTAKEVSQLLSNYENIPLEKQTCTGPGIHMYPSSFTAINQKMSEGSQLADFYNENLDFWNQFEEQFGFDYLSKLKSLFSKISTWDAIEPPKDNKGREGLHTPSTFRCLQPNSGQLKLHCGRFFHENFTQFYDDLKQISDIFHQLSYFVTLRKAEEGGMLKLFNVTWEDASKKIDELVLESNYGSAIALESSKEVESRVIDLGAGDLFLFKGARIWHQVVEVKGKKSRITLGSFVSRSIQEDKLHIWS